MSSISRVKVYAKYRKSILKNTHFICNTEYSPRHLFTKIEEKRKEINLPTSEVLLKQKKYDLMVSKKNQKRLLVQILFTILIFAVCLLFAFFAFKE